MKSKVEVLEKVLSGLLGPHQKMLLATQLEHIDFLDQKIVYLDREIGERLRLFEEELQLLDTIPGVGKRAAELILAEIGSDMDRFPTSAHPSWAGMVLGNNESAGKRKSGRTRKGNKHLRSALVMAVRAATRNKDSYLSAQYHRLAARRGSNRAAVAVGHSILVIVYHLLKNRKPYYELGANYFDKRKATVVAKMAIKRLEALGYKVSIESSEAA